MSQLNLSIIIVNYNASIYLFECIDSIFKYLSNINYEIIVIDNASTDDSLEKIRGLNCTIVKLQENVGFVKANNIGANIANGKYLYFLNPDTILLDGNVSVLLNFIEENSDIGVIAPKVLNPNLSIQFTCRKEPTIRRLFFYLFGFSKLFKRINFFVDYKMELEDFNEILYPDWVSGCAIIIKKELFQSANGFDEDLFMYWEDVSLCKSIRLKGYKIVFNPEHSIIHYGGISSSNVKLFSSFMDIKSRFVYFKKHTSTLYYIIIKFISYSNIILKAIYELVSFRWSNFLVYKDLLTKIIK